MSISKLEQLPLGLSTNINETGARLNLLASNSDRSKRISLYMDFVLPALKTIRSYNFKRKETKIMPAELVEKPTRIDEALREVSRIKSTVTDAVDEGVRSATRAIKRGGHAAEDMIDETKHTIKQKPFQAVAIVFAVGVLLGSVLTWLGGSRRTS